MSSLAVRPGIEEIAPYVGGDSALPGRQRVIRLASNEGALGPSPMAVGAFEEMARDIHRYPGWRLVPSLRTALAELHGLDGARIVCGAGSDELIALLCRAYAGPGDEILHTEHAFLMYAIAARTAGATPVAAPERDLTADVDALLERVTGKTRILFLANPNNPTGTYLPASELGRLRAGLREDVLLVIDAAYAEYVESDDYTPGAALVEAGDNVVMTRTFSKLYALGGLRLGWAYCPTGVADVLNRVRNPFNVAAPAQAAGVAALRRHRLRGRRTRQQRDMAAVAHRARCGRWALRRRTVPATSCWCGSPNAPGTRRRCGQRLSQGSRHHCAPHGSVWAARCAAHYGGPRRRDARHRRGARSLCRLTHGRRRAIPRCSDAWPSSAVG